MDTLTLTSLCLSTESPNKEPYEQSLTVPGHLGLKSIGVLL